MKRSELRQLIKEELLKEGPPQFAERPSAYRNEMKKIATEAGKNLNKLTYKYAQDNPDAMVEMHKLFYSILNDIVGK